MKKSMKEIVKGVAGVGVAIGGAAFTEDDGTTWTTLPTDAIVSMNMWAFC